MLTNCFGEFMGTLMLILLGNGVVANVLLRRSKAEGAGWMVIASGWAFAVMAGVFTAIACGSSDAHLNPAVTMGFAVSTGHFAKFAPYLLAQMAGAFAGAILVWHHFLPHGGGDSRSSAETRLLLHRACYPQIWRKLGQRDRRNARPGFRRGRDFLQGGCYVGSSIGLGPIPCRSTGLGNRALSWRNHGVCH